ncbi:MAG: glycosyltransferase [Gemmatimonadota bacterium]
MFSVVMPTFNRAGLLRRALQSLKDQTFRDFELLVVDDGSADETDDVLAAYGGRLEVIRSDRRGAPMARNAAIARASGRYLVFLDDDDVFFPWALATLRDAIELHGSPALVCSRILEFSRDEELADVRRDPLRIDRWADFLEATRARYNITLPGTAVRTDLARAAGGFFEEHVAGEEHDLFLRLGEAEGFLFIQSPPVFGYYQHADTLSRDTRYLYLGARHLRRREESGLYAGGGKRRAERALLLSRITDYSVTRASSAGDMHYAVAIWLTGLRWYLRCGRTKHAFLDLPLRPVRHAWGRNLRRIRRSLPDRDGAGRAEPRV